MWHQFDNAQTCTKAMVADIRFLLEKTLIEKNKAVLAVSGGRSPILLFQALSTQDINWKDVHIILVDERYVAPDHPDSNERLVREHLLQNQASKAQFTGLAHQADSLAGDVIQANQNLPAADIIILGMGDDGHTASLFAHAPQIRKGTMLNDSEYSRYVHISPPDAPHERISLTFAAMKDANCLMLQIQGATKRDVFERASLRVSDDYPISHLISKKWTGAHLQIYWHP